MEKIEILSECVIKIENVKAEPVDVTEEEACSLRSTGDE
ncbi:Protein of unknown function [Gryllus bimaculatus]|nr:Protein of unknown function [Gryllus bimaculatus]